MDREAWCTAVHGIPKSWTWLSHSTEMMWALNSHDLEIHSLYPIPIQMCPSGFQISGQTVTVLLLHSSEYRTSSRRNVLQCGELLMLILSPRMYRYCELCLIQANWRIPSMRSLLKTQHSKKEDHGIWSHHFMAYRWRNKGNSDRLNFIGLQNHCGWWL